MDPHPDNPSLFTNRLVIRPFQPDDLLTIHRILTAEFHEHGQDEPAAMDEHVDRAVILRSGNTLVGAVGLVPCLSPFEQIPEMRAGPKS